MNCFSNVEKWFMNQKEKCSPKLASINNDFYSRIPPMVSFIFSKDGMEITKAPQGWMLGTNKEARVEKLERWFLRQRQRATCGNGWDYPPGASPPWGHLLLSPFSHSPGIMHWIKSASHLSNCKLEPASSVFKKNLHWIHCLKIEHSGKPCKAEWQLKVPSPGLLSGENSRTALDLQGKDRN